MLLKVRVISKSGYYSYYPIKSIQQRFNSKFSDLMWENGHSLVTKKNRWWEKVYFYNQKESKYLQVSAEYLYNHTLYGLF